MLADIYKVSVITVATYSVVVGVLYYTIFGGI